MTGVGLHSNSIDVTVYPNPSNGNVTVKLNSVNNLTSESFSAPHSLFL